MTMLFQLFSCSFVCLFVFFLGGKLLVIGQTTSYFHEPYAFLALTDLMLPNRVLERRGRNLWQRGKRNSSGCLGVTDGSFKHSKK
jgi:hypothetical protein